VLIYRVGIADNLERPLVVSLRAGGGPSVTPAWCYAETSLSGRFGAGLNTLCAQKGANAFLSEPYLAIWRLAAFRYSHNSSSRALASFKSDVSKPSLNRP
jgi:hypothetical protein